MFFYLQPYTALVHVQQSIEVFPLLSDQTPATSSGGLTPATGIIFVLLYTLLVESLPFFPYIIFDYKFIYFIEIL